MTDAIGTAEANRCARWLARLAAAAVLSLVSVLPCTAAERVLRYFPGGSIYEYRWKLLEIVLNHAPDASGPYRLQPYPEEVTQNRGVSLLQAGAIDVIALGTNAEREEKMLPIRVDILRGIVGLRLLVIRATDQERIARMDDRAFCRQLLFGLNSQWADLPIMQANGLSVITSPNYENLFGMLAVGRFDAFPRGLNEAKRELDDHKTSFPQLAIERTRALFFPFPIYFWVNKDNTALAKVIESGLMASLADNSFRSFFERYHANEIAEMKTAKRHIIMLDNPILPASITETDTSWWWPDAPTSRPSPR